MAYGINHANALYIASEHDIQYMEKPYDESDGMIANPADAKRKEMMNQIFCGLIDDIKKSSIGLFNSKNFSDDFFTKA